MALSPPLSVTGRSHLLLGKVLFVIHEPAGEKNRKGFIGLVLCFGVYIAHLFELFAFRFVYDERHQKKSNFFPETVTGFMAFPTFEDNPTYSTSMGSFLLLRSHPALVAPVPPKHGKWSLILSDD